MPDVLQQQAKANGNRRSASVITQAATIISEIGAT